MEPRGISLDRENNFAECISGFGWAHMLVPGQQRLIDDVRAMSACPSTSDISLRYGKRRNRPGSDSRASGLAALKSVDFFRVRGAEIWKRRELNDTLRPFSRPTWLDTAGL